MVLYKMILPPIVLSAFPNTRHLPPFSLTYAVKFFAHRQMEKKARARISSPALTLLFLLILILYSNTTQPNFQFCKTYLTLSDRIFPNECILYLLQAFGVPQHNCHHYQWRH